MGGGKGREVREGKVGGSNRNEGKNGGERIEERGGRGKRSGQG